MSIVNSTAAVNTPVVYPQTTGVDRADGANAKDEEFAGILSDALKELTDSTRTQALNTGMLTGGGDGMMGGMPASFLPMTTLNDTLEQAMLKAASTGDSNDAMMALVMLMMMMESSSGSGEMGMMMQMMAAVMDQMQEKDDIRDKFLYSSGAAPYTLDTIDTQVFRYNIPTVTGTEEAVLPLQWWRPTTPALVSTEYDRDPELYSAVVDQFNVETAERYRPGREGYTFCNVYVWDVTRAMGAELPYYSDPVTGAPREYPDTKGANYNGAIAMDRWLKTYGEQYGWRQVTAEEAQMHANQGRPAVTAAADVGHVQMVIPSKDGTFDPVRGVTIAQAGRTVSNYMHISGIYGGATLRDKVTYWAHD